MSIRQEAAMSVVKFKPEDQPCFQADQAKRDNTVGQMLRLARIGAKMKQSDVAREMEKRGLHTISRSVGNWETGIAVPNAYQLLALSQILGIKDMYSAFSGEEAKVELNAEGLALIREFSNYLVASGRFIKGTDEEEDEGTIELNHSIYKPAAGFGNFFAEECMEKLSYPRTIVPRGTDFTVTISGESMEPRFQNGQDVFVQKTESLEPGDIGIFALNDELYIKKYTEQTPAGGEAESFTDSYGTVHPQPVLISLNPDQDTYRPIVTHPDDKLMIFGKVLG